MSTPAPHPTPSQPNSMRALCDFTRQHPRVTILAVITLCLLIFIPIISSLPSYQPCEGSLTLQSINFESSNSQPFIVNVPSLRQVTLVGKTPLSLTGEFPDQPGLNTVGPLKLIPEDETATLQITSLAEANLELIDLSLEPGTRVEQLRYDAYNKRLNFNLSDAQSTRLRFNPDGLFSLQLEGYSIEGQPNFPTDEPLSWRPDNQLDLDLPAVIFLDLQFNEFTETPFWGRLSIKNLKLDELSIRTQEDNTQYTESAILAGNVRLADRSYRLVANQFLTFNPTDSVDTLMRLSLAEAKSEIRSGDNQTLKLHESATGLKLDFSGTALQILVGLNPNNPVFKLQASWLEKWMPRDAVIGLIAFLSTLVMTLIGWLGDMVIKRKSSNAGNSANTTP